jgi:hypothetical protein
MRLSDAGEYTCLFFLDTTHPYIGDSVFTMRNAVINIMLPNNQIPSIINNPMKSIYEVGDNVTLSCSITYPQSSFIDIDIDINVNMQWQYNNTIIQSYTAINDYTIHTLLYHINKMRLSDAGEYTCLFFLDTTHPYIGDSVFTMRNAVINIMCKLCLIIHLFVFYQLYLVPNNQIPSIINNLMKSIYEVAMKSIYEVGDNV